MIKLIKDFFAPTEKIDIDKDTVFSLSDRIIKLQKRIEKLETENVELTNALYECENRLESKIDNIHPIIYNIEDKGLNGFGLGDS